MTETGMSCSNPLNGDRRANSVGPPLPGVEVRIVDEDGAELTRGEIGSLEVKGEHVFKVTGSSRKGCLRTKAIGSSQVTWRLCQTMATCLSWVVAKISSLVGSISSARN